MRYIDAQKLADDYELTRSECSGEIKRTEKTLFVSPMLEYYDQATGRLVHDYVNNEKFLANCVEDGEIIIPANTEYELLGTSWPRFSSQVFWYYLHNFDCVIMLVGCSMEELSQDDED